MNETIIGVAVTAVFLVGALALALRTGRAVQREKEERRLHPEAFPPPATRLIVTDVDIPFGRLVGILTRIALAAIPATLIVMLVVGLVWAVILAGAVGGRR
jgi:hypothetical protein